MRQNPNLANLVKKDDQENLIVLTGVTVKILLNLDKSCKSCSKRRKNAYRIP